MNEIKIKPIANYHGIFLMTAGISLLIISLTLASYFWQVLPLAMISLILISLVTFFIGLVKKLEPGHSLIITPKRLAYHHRYGTWSFDWHQVQRIDQPKVHVGFSQVELPYIGIKLKDFDQFHQQISVRLASRLIHEQRPLVIAAIKDELINFNQGLVNFSPYKTNAGIVIKGPIAGFMYHSNALAGAYGFHLYVPLSALDRSITEGIALLKQCQRHQQKD